MARQQPVARDLRLVVSAMQVSSSLERMGDLADHVAKLTRMRHPRSSVPEDVRPMFAQMGAVADQMATRTAALLKSRDLAEASEILAMDDQMDQVHRDLFTAVLAPTWTHGVQAAIDTTLMSRYYERYADHAVAVARRVIQLVTGAPFSQTGTTGPASDPPDQGSPGIVGRRDFAQGWPTRLRAAPCRTARRPYRAGHDHRDHRAGPVGG